MGKKALLIFVFILIISFIFLYLRGAKNEPESEDNAITKIPTISENDPPAIVSTKPDPLEEAVISAMEEIEITFSHSLENEGQFKIKIEPKTDYKVVLTQDRKTAKIIPLKPYALGAGYTLFILPDSKFDGIGEWKREKIFHFQTIKYRGV